MTTSQGNIQQIEQRLTKIISEIVCKETTKFADSATLNDSITKMVLKEFEEDLNRKITESFLKYANPKLYEKQIYTAMLEFSKKNYDKIMNLG
jgi:ABC-type phosphate/phosphonate transport system substrate-binding protein